MYQQREPTMYEIALYGGAFNPPHAGHAQVMVQASHQARRVLVAPSFRHPYGKRMADFELRMNWLQAIVAHVQSRCAAEVRVSRIEQQLARDVEGAIYSYTLLDRLAAGLDIPDKQIALVVGEDVQALLPSFYRGAELLQRFSVLCVGEQIGVRSTAMRERLAQGESLPSHWMAPGMDPLNYGLYAAHGN